MLRYTCSWWQVVQTTGLKKWLTQLHFMLSKHVVLVWEQICNWSVWEICLSYDDHLKENLKWPAICQLCVTCSELKLCWALSCTLDLEMHMMALSSSASIFMQLFLYSLSLIGLHYNPCHPSSLTFPEAITNSLRTWMWPQVVRHNISESSYEPEAST